MLESLLPGSVVQTALIGLVVGLIVYKYLKNRKYNMPPGPLCLPLLGNTLQLGSDERYHMKYYEWSKKYGPVITVGLGPMKLVVVNDIDTVLEILVKKSTDFAGRPSSPSIGTLTDGYKDILFTHYGPTWKLHRRIATKALRHYMQGRALEERIHTALETAFPVLNDKKGAFNPDEVINFLVTNILLGLCFKETCEYGDKEVKYILEKDEELSSIFNNFIPEDMVPFLQHFFKSKVMRKIREYSQEVTFGFVGRKFYEQRKTFDRDNIRHFADTLLLAKEEADKEEGEKADLLTDSHLIQTLTDIFFAGIDTSRLTLYFAILHMIAFPDIQKKVQEEIDIVVGRERLPGLEDRPNLGYTEAVLHESMRLSTVIPGGVFHSTTCDTDIGGYKIPKDTLIMINHWALHHDPQAWDEVERFKPERFLDEHGRLGPKPQNWLPFSAGKRVCLGEFVAKPELHLLFAGLMQQFTWRSESGVSVDTVPKGNVFLANPTPHNVLVSRRTPTGTD